MNFKLLLSTIATFCLLSSEESVSHAKHDPSHSHSPDKEHLCSGIIEEHNYTMPLRLLSQSNISEEAFNKILSRIEEVYAPEFAALGGIFNVERLWDDNTLNAYASRRGQLYTITMMGGLARHPAISEDGFMLVACHEVGHHVGGSPRYLMRGYSNEGQADYYASLRCTRKVWSDAENAAWYEGAEIDQEVLARCRLQHGLTPEATLCMRSSMAGLSLASFFKEVRKEVAEPKFNTPDIKVVTQTYERHPATQCRLDTYFSSALCAHDWNVPLSNTDERDGTCHQQFGDTEGTRPLCWHKPIENSPLPLKTLSMNFR